MAVINIACRPTTKATKPRNKKLNPVDFVAGRYSLDAALMATINVITTLNAT